MTSLCLEVSKIHVMKNLYMIVGLLLLIFSGCSSSEPPRFNIIYISFDNMCPDWGVYGDTLAYTPNFDAFARRSVLFTDAHAQVSLSNPSRISILSGLRPSTTGMVHEDDLWENLSKQVISLPRHFQNHGWFTSSVGKIFDAAAGITDSGFVAVRSAGGGITGNAPALEALREAASQEQPFFLAIGYHHTQLPWIPSEAGRKRHNPENFSTEHRTPLFQDLFLTDEDIRVLMRAYYATITDADSLFGLLFDEIRNLDLLDNTIIIVGSLDNGFSHGYNGRWGNGGNTDRETHVPLMIRVPGFSGNGKKATGLVELVDIYPTLIDLSRLPPPPHRLEGTSFRRLLRNTSLRWKKAVFSHQGYQIENQAVKTRKYTLIRSGHRGIELFDRTNDPLNLHNIAPENQNIVNGMLRIHDQGWEVAKPPRRIF
jgi:iduronate 2-sulfatase